MSMPCPKRERVALCVLSCVLALCLGLLPVTALAEPTGGAPEWLYVGNQRVSISDITYWTTDTDGKLTASAESGNWNVKYDLSTVTLTLKDANISGSYNQQFNPYTAGIYALCSNNQSVALTIELIGTNTITGHYGIYVNAGQTSATGTDASLAIKNSSNNGSLTVTGTGDSGLFISSGTGDASLTIENASVDAKTTSGNSTYAGVCVQSGNSATGSPNISLAVDGGSLTASGTGSSDGILFVVGYPSASATTSLTVTNQAIVDARNGGIKALKSADTLPTPTPTGGNSSGIVFDGSAGTVYGSVTLQDDLEIKSGETLTVPDGSSLNCNGKLTNSGTILASGGTVSGNLSGGTAVTTPSITGQPTDKTVTEGQGATFAVEASDAQTYQWQQKTAASGSDGADISQATSASYTTEATTTSMSGYQYRCVVKSASGVGVISQAAALTVDAKPAVSVTLDRTELSLYVGESATLTATVEPSDAASPNVTWSTNDDKVATVESGDNNKATVTAVGAGATDVTIAVSAGDASCTAVCKVTVRSRPSYNPPTASEKAIDAIQDARPGDTVEISLSTSQTKLDKEVFEGLAGRDVTLVVAVPGGAAWTVYGKDVPEGVDLSDIDLGAALGGDGIPADVVNAVTGEAGTVQLSLAHDGPFGFEMTLTAPLGEGCAGYWANLYHYDEEAGRLVFRAASTVGADGRTSFALSHASEWAIVVDSSSHELPFADVSPSDWFANAVGEAYRSGLMTGYADGPGLFGPDDGLTRAQAATVLFRALGQGAQAPSCGMADVDPGAWYAGAVGWAYRSGLMTGYADGSGLFGVEDALTREQLATVLWRAAGSPDAGAFDGSAFSDGGEASEWAGPALAWAVQSGVLGGSDDGAGGTELRPGAAVTRAEMAAMVSRWLTTE